MYKSFKARYIQVLLDIRDIHCGEFTILRTKCTQLRRSFLPNPGHVAAYVCQCYLFVSSKALQTNRALIPRALLGYGVRTRERGFHFTTPQKESSLQVQTLSGSSKFQMDWCLRFSEGFDQSRSNTPLGRMLRYGN